MSLLVLSSADVNKISHEIPQYDLINLMALVFARLSSNYGVTSLPRTSISTPNHNTLFMPSRLSDSGTAIKIVSVPTSSSDIRGLPASTLLIDEQSGSVKAIVNARRLTALRNAAGSALATKLALESSAKPERLVVFGAGAQIEAHINIFLRVFSPSLTHCAIFNRSLNSRLENLVSSLKQKHPSITFVSKQISSIASSEDSEKCKQLIGSADIICTATSSFRPLFPGHYVKPGTHVNLIGSYTSSMMEIDTELVDRAGVIVVDSKEACLVEAGDLNSACVHENRMLELGELIEIQTPSINSSGGHEGGEYRVVEEKRRLIGNGGDVTIFKSVGVGIQDVAIASLVVKFAEENDLGIRIQAYDT